MKGTKVLCPKGGHPNAIQVGFRIVLRVKESVLVRKNLSLALRALAACLLMALAVAQVDY